MENTGSISGIKNIRRIKRHLLLLLSVCSLLTACGGDDVSLSPLPPGTTVVAFGDSLTAGYGAGPGQSYPEVLAELAVLDIVNAGNSGEVLAAGLQRLPSVLAEYRPALVILCHAGNDLLRSTGLAAAKANLLAMINQIHASGAQVVLLGVPQPGLLLSTADFYQEIAEETAVAYLPDTMTDVLSQRSLRSDAAHPNAAGYRLVAEEVHGFLLDAGAL